MTQGESGEGTPPPLDRPTYPPPGSAPPGGPPSGGPPTSGAPYAGPAQRVMDELWQVGARGILTTDIHACRL